MSFWKFIINLIFLPPTVVSVPWLSRPHDESKSEPHCTEKWGNDHDSNTNSTHAIDSAGGNWKRPDTFLQLRRRNSKKFSKLHVSIAALTLGKPRLLAPSAQPAVPTTQAISHTGVPIFFQKIFHRLGFLHSFILGFQFFFKEKVHTKTGPDLLLLVSHFVCFFKLLVVYA